MPLLGSALVALGVLQRQCVTHCGVRILRSRWDSAIQVILAHGHLGCLATIEGTTPGGQHGVVAVGMRQLSQRHAYDRASGARCWE